MTPAIEGRGLCKRYGAIAAISEVSISVAAGEFTVILGPSGAGKTTLSMSDPAHRTGCGHDFSRGAPLARLARAQAGGSA